MKKKVVVLSGAGMSAESGISTFRDAGGLWEGHDVMTVASPEGWRKNSELVLEFYNQRRRQLLAVQPNAGHRALAALEKDFEVIIVTQNVDDLHERAGSSQVIHLHGELLKVRSTSFPELIYDWREDLKTGDCCERGTQLRPHIVWFGEMGPMLETAAEIVCEADFLFIVGTSLQVYPAAGLVHYARAGIPVFYIDPKAFSYPSVSNLKLIAKPATTGVPEAISEISRLVI